MLSGAAIVRNTLELRKYNKKQVIEILRDHSSLTKNEIASALGLSISTVGNICRELLAAGIIREEPTDLSTGGRSPRSIVLNPASRFIAGLDLTRNEEAVLRLSDLNNGELGRATINLSAESNLADLVERVRCAFLGFLEEKRLSTGTALGMGVIVPGWYDQTSGKVLNSTNVLIEGSSLKQDLEAALGIPVLVGNDANLGALALSRTVEKPSYSFIALVYVGMGLGIGVVGNGNILSGSRGFAAEMAHLPVGDPEIRCYCGNYGCLEGIVSLPGVLRMYYGSDDTDNRSPMESFRRIIHAFKSGEQRAREVLERFSDYLGLAISIVINMFDCEAVYVGGIVDDIFDDILPHTYDQVLKRVPLVEIRSPQIRGVGSTQAVLFAGCTEVVFQNWVP